MDEIVSTVRESLSTATREEFERRVRRQADVAVEDYRSDRLENRAFALGLELEAYVVDDEGRLTRAPEAIFELAGCDKELGEHNVELHTRPDVFDAGGVDRQAAEIRECLRRAREVAAEAGCRLVLDGMWTVPPAEGSEAYLGAVREVDGVVVAENMRANGRYAAIDNEVLRRAGGEVRLTVPGVSRTFPSILFESLATSIQPHLQVPDTDAFPRYFNAAIRTLGPVLALATNSPFLPADLYEPLERDPGELVASTYHELRIPVFEQSVNADPDRAKVRVPEDIESVEAVVERLVEDQTYAPHLADEEDPEDYAERYPELRHKRGTYWRWVRAVIGGDVPRTGDGRATGNDAASVRIEYRPLPTQPTATDVVGFQALVAGLLRGLVAADHPLPDLDRAAAEGSFYDAVERGLDADLAWLTADGERTDDPEVVYEEVFAHARRGLAAAGVPDDRIEELLAPIEARWAARTTPSVWKKERVRERLAEGDSLTEAIGAMQREYVERAAETDSFADWL